MKIEYAVKNVGRIKNCQGFQEPTLKMFAVSEYADVYLVFDQCEGNATAAPRVSTECCRVRR